MKAGGKLVRWGVVLGLAAAVALAGLITVVDEGKEKASDARSDAGFNLTPIEDSFKPGPGPGAPRDKAPNIVLLMADDLDNDVFEAAMPKTKARMGQGTTFTQAYVTTPLCCPSRASMLTGRYGHNNGVLRNNPGYPAMRGKATTLPSRLRSEGYRTAMVGKFMNGWERTDAGEAGRAAPGWDDWVAMRRTYGYYGYELAENGEIVGYGDEREDYLTDVLTERGLEAVERGLESKRPFFLWQSWWAPHPELSEASEGECKGSAIPPDFTVGDYAETSLPGGEDAIDEEDVSDKPAFIQEKRPLRPGDRRAARQSYRCRLASMGAVDDGVERIFEAIDEAGELDNTIFIFTSDNGFFHLEHRLPEGKGLPYDEAVRVPLQILLPDRYRRQPAKSGSPVANIDLAPTILEYASGDKQICPLRTAEPCPRFDGLSLKPVLQGSRASAVSRRRGVLLESVDGRPCPFAAVVTGTQMYAEHARVPGQELCPGERELYLEDDPAQLRNQLAEPIRGISRAVADTAARKARLLGRLEACAGTSLTPIPGRKPCD